MSHTIPHQQHTSGRDLQASRLDDQTWDEYLSTCYAIARMRGERPELHTVGLGLDVFGFGGGR